MLKDIKCSFKVDIGELAKDYGLCINGYNKLSSDIIIEFVLPC